ncbi:MAG TPA: hypothetical protein VEW03_08365, partial [Longimicrobiaceae bacterium]|nr:hypothetical protein [Longimicrobiaceae bacterium]
CAALLLLFTGDLAAQQCRRYQGGRVTVCERERDRDRDHDRRRGWDAGPVEFGVRGGFDFEDEAGTAGAQFRIPVVRQLMLSPSADVFFDGSDSEWQINADLLVRPEALAGVYFGAGAAFLNRDFELLDDAETEVGYNLIVGLDGGRFGGTILRPFVEGRWTQVDEFDGFRLAAGFNVPISGWR